MAPSSFNEIKIVEWSLLSVAFINDERSYHTFTFLVDEAIVEHCLEGLTLVNGSSHE